MPENPMLPNPQRRAIVIGAGLSGLAAANALRARRIPVTVLEAAERVAEPWRARHPQLRLNIHRHFAALPGLPMTREDGTFVRRDTVVSYLETYAAALDGMIAYGTRVRSVSRTSGGWKVDTDRGDYFCTDLIVATGRDRLPVMPSWPGVDRFAQKILHASELGDIERYAGKKVLVIGAGNSGTDVLNHLARIEPAKVWVSIRHGPAILPTRMLGFPLHRLAKVFALFPARLLDPMFKVTAWLAFGDLERFGMKSHPDGGGTRLLRDGVAFALDDGFIRALKAGRIEAVAETVRFESGTVELADGRSITPDVVIAATGYRPGILPILGDLDVLDENGQPRHPMGEPDPAHPGLWFTGFRPVFTGYFHAAGVAAERIGDAIAGASSGSSDIAIDAVATASAA
jgi:cation diffusion facilitator CzcD-associated flavoprotein CzcO